MSSESAARRLLLAAGGLAAVGVTSLGLTLATSNESPSAATEPAPSTSFAPSTQPTVSLAPATSAVTVVPAIVPGTTIPSLGANQVWVYNGSEKRVGLFDIGAGLLKWTSQPGDDMPESWDYQMNGGIAALFEKATGNLWVGPDNELVGASYPEEPDTVLPEDSRVVVTSTGTVLVLVVAGEGWFELRLDQRLKPIATAPSTIAPEPTASSTSVRDTTSPEPTASSTTIPELTATGATSPESIPTSSTVAVTSTSHGSTRPERRSVPEQFNEDRGTTAVSAVGETLVYLSSTGSLFTDDIDLELQGENPVLQQPGPESDFVLVASNEGLFNVDLSSGEKTQLVEGMEGIPARPVRVGDCIFAAWSGQELTWYKSCGGKLAQPAKIPAAPNNFTLVFRVNGESVALNAVDTGVVWVEHDFPLTRAIESWPPPEAAEVTS